MLTIVKYKHKLTHFLFYSSLITFISALGGIVVFGFFGFIYGPVLAAGFLTALDIYREYRRDAEKKALKHTKKDYNKKISSV